MEQLLERLQCLADEWTVDAALHSARDHKGGIFSEYGRGECDAEERLSEEHARQLQSVLDAVR